MENDLQLLAIFDKEQSHRYDLVSNNSFIQDYWIALDDVVTKTEDNAAVVTPLAVGGAANFTDLILNMNASGKLIASYDGLSSTVLKKLRDGVYRIPDSKQVGDQLRPCIVDEDNRIVKWLTLKEVKNSREWLSNCNNFAVQSALYAVVQKLDAISSDVNYLIRFERRINLQNPFFNARTYLRTAACTTDADYRKQQIFKALDNLQEGLTAVYSDFSENLSRLQMLYSKKLSSLSEMDKYSSYIAEDMSLIPKYAAVLSYVYNYLGDYNNAQRIFDDYKHFVKELRTENIGTGKRITGVELLQLVFLYNSDNLDFWIYETEAMQEKLESANIRTLGEEDSMYYLCLSENE